MDKIVMRRNPVTVSSDNYEYDYDSYFFSFWVKSFDVNINFCDLNIMFNKIIEFITSYDNNISIFNRWNLTCARFSILIFRMESFHF